MRGFTMSRRPLAQAGSVHAIVYRDLNDNGARDPDEPLEKGALITTGTKQADRPTDAKGSVTVAGLGTYIPVAVGIDETSLADPMLVPKKALQVVVPRPGVPAEVREMGLPLHRGRADHQDADHQHHRAPRQEADVVRQLVRTGPDVVEAEEVVIDDPFHDVEQAPADERATDQRPDAARPMTSAVRGHEHEHAGNGQGPGRGVKQAVAERVCLQVLQGRRRLGVLTMWCHWRIWCSTMPSNSPPSPRPSRTAATVRRRRSGSRRPLGACVPPLRWLRPTVASRAGRRAERCAVACLQAGDTVDPEAAPSGRPPGGCRCTAASIRPLAGALVRPVAPGRAPRPSSGPSMKPAHGSPPGRRAAPHRHTPVEAPDTPLATFDRPGVRHTLRRPAGRLGVLSTSLSRDAPAPQGIARGRRVRDSCPRR